jgi:hypothetical protein
LIHQGDTGKKLSYLTRCNRFKEPFSQMILSLCLIAPLGSIVTLRQKRLERQSM